MSDNNVIKTVIVVAMGAKFGFFNKLLFIKTKVILANTAEDIAKINFQLVIKEKSVSNLNKLPLISDRSPNKTMETVVAMQ
ncbi:hypothetical protein [uncultured Aquimarina sp.]|uniref:hypothetical protein n=1 Tax=uncultured Aquimarina sp. TaxID=575652 RepID=UPI0026139495|nr:hypothetical protein [uncultured Aquimarina sp.]